MLSYFDNLIRAGRDTEAVRMLAKELYNGGKMGHTRKLLLERVADKLDKAEAEVERLRKIMDVDEEIKRLSKANMKLNHDNGQLTTACETMQEQGRQYQESNAALQAKLDNAIDTAFDLEAENALLRKVVRDLLEVVEMLHPNMNPDEPCVVYEAWVQGKQALAEYDKTNISSEGE